MRKMKKSLVCLIFAILLLAGCTSTEENAPDIVDVPHVANNNANRISEDETPETPYNNYPDDESEVNEAMMATISFAQAYGLTVNEDGLIKVVRPQSLLGGRTADSVVNGFLEAADTPEFQAILSDVFTNADGTLTMLLTTEQLTQYRHNMRMFSRFHERHNLPSISDIIFDDEIMLTEITVIVKAYEFKQSLVERTVAGVTLATNAGLYQILHGVSPDEWHVTITVKDYETGEIVSITEFPHDDMFTIQFGDD